MEIVMRNSRRAQAVLYAHQKGYLVQDNGAVMGVRRHELCLQERQGYLCFNVHPHWSAYSIPVPVHQLAAFQKFGKEALGASIEVRHLDSNPLNNARDNIGIGSHSDNMMDKPRSQRRRLARKAGRSNSEISEQDVRRIRYLREELGWKYSQILKEYPMAKSTLSLICNYKTWKDV